MGGETLTVEEALETMTANGAYASHSSDFKGTLAPGMAADIAVWNRNLLKAEPEAILHEARADLTFVDGRLAFDRHGEAG
jgi:hypothetical protein